MNPIRSFAIIPAAGRSQRMGTNKLLLPWHETTVIQHVLAAWTTSQVTRVVVVVRPGDTELVEVCRQNDVDVMIPETAPPDMKASIQHGLRHVERAYAPRETDVWMLAPADMPCLSTPIIDRLLAKYRPDTPTISVPATANRRGHPVLFPWRLSHEVFGLSSNEGVNLLLTRHAVRELACSDDEIPDDLDTPEDFRRLQNREFPS